MKKSLSENFVVFRVYTHDGGENARWRPHVAPCLTQGEAEAIARDHAADGYNARVYREEVSIVYRAIPPGGTAANDNESE